MPATDHEALGRADATAQLRGSALNCVNAVRKIRNLPPVHQIQYAEIESDNLLNLFLIIAEEFSTRPIPANADENLMPRNKSNKKCCMATTLSKYIGQLKSYLMEKFPHHPDFANKQDPSWYKNLINQFERDCNRFHMNIKGNEDIVFGDTTVNPLYRGRDKAINSLGTEADETMWYLEGYQNPIINDWLSLVDMRSICKELMRSARTLNNRNFQYRAWIVLLYAAAGRGGEIKFLNFSEWKYYPYIEVLDIRWTEIKVLSKYAMGLVPDRSTYLLDPYHALACFFALERGLFRTREQIHRSLGNYLFPDLHNISNDRVTGEVSKVIKKALPNNMPSEIKNQYSAKATRKGAVSTMAVHPQCGIFETCARTGHKTGTNIDYYNDKNSVERTLIGGRVLSGWQNPTAVTRVPRLESIGFSNKAAIWRFMQELYVISVEYFNPGKPLFPVIKICTASLIMYHEKVTLDLTPANSVSCYLRETARKAGISDPRFPGMSPEAVLMEWSKIVMKDFKAINPELSNADNNLDSMANAINHLATHVTNLTQELAANKNLMEEKEANNERRFSLMQTHYDQERASMVKEISDLRHKLAFIRTPPRVTSTNVSTTPQRRPSVVTTDNRNVRRRLDSSNAAMDLPQPSTNNVSPAAANNSAVNAREENTETCNNTGEVVEGSDSPPVECVNARLVFSTEALFEADGSNANMTIAAILDWLHVKDFLFGLRGPFKDSCGKPKWAKEPSHFYMFLELLDYILTPEQRTVLVLPAKDTPEKERVTLYRLLESAMMNKLYEFEGTTAELERVAKRRGKKPMPTLSGVARRIKEYKKKIHGNSEDGKWSQHALCEPDQIRGNGTPKNNRSIAKMFSTQQHSTD